MMIDDDFYRLMMLTRVNDGSILFGHDFELVELIFRGVRSSVVSMIMLNQKFGIHRTVESRQL